MLSQVISNNGTNINTKNSIDEDNGIRCTNGDAHLIQPNTKEIFPVAPLQIDINSNNFSKSIFEDKINAKLNCKFTMNNVSLKDDLDNSKGPFTNGPNGDSQCDSHSHEPRNYHFLQKVVNSVLFL